MAQTDDDASLQLATQSLLIKDPKVLIADDVDMAAKLLGSFVRRLGFRFITTSLDGEQALHAFTLVHPHLVFLDIEMPRMDGLEVLRRMREQDPHALAPHGRRTFITMVSAHSTLNHIQEAVKSGADGFLVKPYTNQKLAGIVKKFYERWQKKNGVLV